MGVIRSLLVAFLLVSSFVLPAWAEEVSVESSVSESENSSSAPAAEANEAPSALVAMENDVVAEEAMVVASEENSPEPVSLPPEPTNPIIKNVEPLPDPVKS